MEFVGFEIFRSLTNDAKNVRAGNLKTDDEQIEVAKQAKSFVVVIVIN